MKKINIKTIKEAIDTEFNKMFIHNVSSGLIFKRFMRHDMAPMTGRIANRETNGLIFGFGFL